MRTRHKKLMKFSLKVTYITLLLLCGYKVYSMVDTITLQYFVSVGIALVIVKLYSLPRMVFEYIDSNTESKNRKRKTY